MAAYATVQDIQTRLGKTFDTTQSSVCTSLLDEAALIIDAYNVNATTDAKKDVSIRMVSRAMGTTDEAIPMGSTQGSMSALGYSQSWTIGTGGGVGELYISRLEKKLLGLGGSIGSYSPVQELVPPPPVEVLP